MIKIDTSKVAGVIDGSHVFDKNVYDCWRYKDIIFQEGKIYGLVSEYGQGCMYVSYLLGGEIENEYLQIFVDGKEFTSNDLKRMSWNLEPSKEKYRNLKVRKSIEAAMKLHESKDCFDDISKLFCLTEPRYDRKLFQLSGERWRASAALGYVSEKKIFFAPYKTSSFYRQMSGTPLFSVLRYLAQNGATVFLPVGSDYFMKEVVDECIYLDPK